MLGVEKAIDGYLEAVALAFGQDYRARTRVRPTDSSDVVIEHPDGHKNIVSLEMLNLRSKYLKREAGHKFVA